MNDNNLFDDIARTLASSIPRRQAFRQILRGLAGAALVTVFGVETARADNCSPGQIQYCGVNQNNNNVCCPSGQTCCDSTQGTNLCCKSNETCDGKTCKKNISPS